MLVKSVLRALIVTLLFSMPAAECWAKGALAKCSSRPYQSPPPKLPTSLHNEFTGVAVVSFMVDRTGQVRSPHIVSSNWRPIGRARGQPVGYDQAIVDAVAQWRYLPQVQPCANQVPVEIRFEEADGQ